MYNANNRKDIRKAEKLAKISATMERDFIVGSMSTTNGRLWFWNILTVCHSRRTSFVPADALTMAFNEGERNVGLRIEAAIMAHCPELYVKMAQEAAARENEIDRTESESGTDDSDESES